MLVFKAEAEFRNRRCQVQTVLMCKLSAISIPIFILFVLVVKGVLLQAVVAHPRNAEMQCNFVLEAGDVPLLTPPVEYDRDERAARNERAARRAKLERLGETNLLVSCELSCCSSVSVFMASLGTVP